MQFLHLIHIEIYENMSIETASSSNNIKTGKRQSGRVKRICLMVLTGRKHWLKLTLP